MKIGQYCQRQRCRHVELEQFWQAFASRGFVSDSWAFLYTKLLIYQRNYVLQLCCCTVVGLQDEYELVMCRCSWPFRAEWSWRRRTRRMAGLERIVQSLSQRAAEQHNIIIAPC